MTKENLILIKRIYSVLFSIVIVVAGICFIAGALSIYNSGDQPYSREVVAETFSKIAFPVYLCLGMTVLSFILEILLPSNKEKDKMFKPYQAILNRLYENRDFSKCEDTVRTEILSLQKSRKLHCIIRLVVIIISSIAFLIYALNGDNFHQSEINGSMVQAMWILLPCVVISFGYALFVNIHNDKSLAKEIELMKQAPTLEKNSDIEITDMPSNTKTNAFRIAFVVIGCFFLVYGLVTGGTVDVLTKAINICTECIGLG